MDDSVKDEVERIRLCPLFMQCNLNADPFSDTCKALDLSYEDIMAVQDQMVHKRTTKMRTADENHQHAFFEQYWKDLNTFEQICHALGLSYEDEKAIQGVMIKRIISNAKARSKPSIILDSGVPIVSTDTSHSETPVPSQMKLLTAKEISDALVPEGMAIRTLIHMSEGRVTEDNSNIFISTVKAVASFRNEIKWLTPHIQVENKQKKTIAELQKILDELQGRNASLEKQVSTPMQNNTTVEDAGPRWRHTLLERCIANTLPCH